jgi:hypothetical protein
MPMITVENQFFAKFFFFNPSLEGGEVRLKSKGSADITRIKYRTKLERALVIIGSTDPKFSFDPMISDLLHSLLQKPSTCKTSNYPQQSNSPIDRYQNFH